MISFRFYAIFESAPAVIDRDVGCEHNSKTCYCHMLERGPPEASPPVQPNTGALE